MGHKNKVKQQKRQAKAQGQGKVEAHAQALSLPIIYYELRKAWPVPQRLVESKMSELCNDPSFVADVDQWLDSQGLSEHVGVERNVTPRGKEGMIVSDFIAEGGFVSYCPDSSSQDHSGLLYKQAQHLQHQANAQANMLLEGEETTAVVQSSKEKATDGAGANDSLMTVIADLQRQMQQLHQQIEDQGQQQIEDQGQLRQEIDDLKRDGLEKQQEIDDLKRGDVEDDAFGGRGLERCMCPVHCPPHNVQPLPAVA